MVIVSIFLALSELVPRRGFLVRGSGGGRGAFGGRAAHALVHPRPYSRGVVANRFANLGEGRRVAGQAALIPGAGADAGNLGQLARIDVFVMVHNRLPW